jgi:hypothetical protein
MAWDGQGKERGRAYGFMGIQEMRNGERKWPGRTIIIFVTSVSLGVLLDVLFKDTVLGSCSFSAQTKQHHQR